MHIYIVRDYSSWTMHTDSKVIHAILLILDGKYYGVARLTDFAMRGYVCSRPVVMDSRILRSWLPTD